MAMFEEMFLERSIEFIIQNYLLISFFGSILAGEVVIISMSILSGQGLIPFWQLFFVFLLGTLVSDSLWFYLGKRLNLRWFKLNKESRMAGKIKKFFNKLVKNREVSLLAVTKVTYGARIASIMYLGNRGMEFLKFLKYNFLVSSVLLLIIMFLGWIAGKGTANFMPLIDNMRKGITIIIIMVILIIIIKSFLVKVFFESGGKNGKKR